MSHDDAATGQRHQKNNAITERNYDLNHICISRPSSGGSLCLQSKIRVGAYRVKYEPGYLLQASPGPASRLRTLSPPLQSIELACLAMSGSVARMFPMSTRRAATIKAASAMPRLLAPIPASMSRVTGSRSATAALIPLVEALMSPAAFCVDRSVARM